MKSQQILTMKCFSFAFIGCDSLTAYKVKAYTQATSKPKIQSVLSKFCWASCCVTYFQCRTTRSIPNQLEDAGVEHRKVII